MEKKCYEMKCISWTKKCKKGKFIYV